MIITKLSNIGVRKVSVQNYHAAVLTLDGRAYIWGRNDHNQVTMDSNMDQSSPKLYNTSKEERVKDVVCGAYYTALLNHNLNLIYFGKGASKCVDLYSPEGGNTDLRDPIVLFRNLLSSLQYTVLNVGGCFDNFFSNYLRDEQKFLEEMLIVQSSVIKPLQKKNGNTTNESLYEELCKNYMDLLYFSAANVQSLLEYSNGLISLCDIIIFRYLEEFIFVYKNYINTIFNVISIDGFLNISKLIEISPNLYKQRPDSFTKKEKNEENVISTYLLAPLDTLDIYSTILDNYTKQREVLTKWSDFVEDKHQKQQQAELTRDFWQNSGKAIDHLKSPDRRLIRDSHKYPIQLQNASRFSSHWFVLFSDLFVHVVGSTPHLHNLTVIWIEPQQDETSQQYQICLKMPEETIVLCTNEAEAKIEWFHALQNAIKTAMNKSEALQPPAVRNGSYLFKNNGFFKDAMYTGRWSNGKMQGNGKLQWSDGKVYTGQFCNNQLCGYGVMEIPNVGK